MNVDIALLPQATGSSLTKAQIGTQSAATPRSFAFIITDLY
jgi:hypothetical protein